jgi:AcrR family transcriptional regulator
MDAASGSSTKVEPGSNSTSKTPRTERGRKTLRKLLDASATEFGEKGFHEASVSSITRRAGVALGTFYTYFDSKDALFQALVKDMSDNVKSSARAALHDDMGAFEIERAALHAFLEFAREHKEIYRIIDEAEFVDAESYRAHYQGIATLIERRLKSGADSGEFRDDVGEVEAWALMGMNVFVGLKFAVWDAGQQDLRELSGAINRMLATGIAAKS